MKENSQKLLLLAYPASRQNFSLTHEQVKVILPDLTPGGRRSLLHHLEKAGHIVKENVMGVQSISLTSSGARECSRLFPSLSTDWDTWEGKWEVMVFLEAPKSDPNFRFLRNQLLEEKALAISRGVYAAPGAFSPKVVETLENLYQNSVAVFETGNWKFGIEKQLVIDQLSLIDVIEGYSGIGREIRELLQICNNNVRLTDQQKQQFKPVFDRFWEIVIIDTGIARFYYPTAPNALELLSELQNLLTCLFPYKN